MIPFKDSVYNGTESISYLGPNVWELVPGNLKSITSVKSLKEQKPGKFPMHVL